MKGWLLDTNVVAALITPSGGSRVKRWAAEQDEETMFLSVLTLGEYDKGIHNLDAGHSERSRYIAARDALEVRFTTRVLYVSDPVIRRWGEISGSIKRTTGHAPSVIDTMMAATAIEHSLFLVTRNVKDVRGSGAAFFNPWKDDSSQFPLA